MANLEESGARRRRNGRARSAENANEIVDLGPLGDWIGFQLRMAQTASFQAFARRTRGLAVRPGHFATLMLISRNPGISQTSLSRANGRDKSTLTPVLGYLERRGFIRRQRTANDRRSYQLTLTRSGEKLVHELAAYARQHDRDLDRIVGARGRARFLALLRKIAAELG